MEISKVCTEKICREKNKKYFVSTGEVSGDLHLSYLIEEVKKIDENAMFYGVIGKYSKRAGAEMVQDIKDLAIMGFTEILTKYRMLKKKAFEYIDFIKKNEIKNVILVDYGGFNLKFLELLKKEIPDIIIYYYIPPKLWVWGKNRIKKLKMANHIMVIFPWEVTFYDENKIQVTYFGNPFIEKYKVIERSNDKILLLPGSRKQEITKLFPELLKLIDKRSEEKFLLKLSSKDHFEWLNINNKKYENLEITFDKTLNECIRESKIAICASGTVTLELALMGLPAIVIYKTGLINAFIARTFLNIGFVSLPNITVNREVYPELLQEQCDARNIERELDDILNNPLRKKIIEDGMVEVRKKLQNDNDNIIENYGKYILG
ncbi:MAG: lipid-A-disaccharide synthase [Fusobacteriaceae bacterium]|jgi:lipid-A-disaccharide synthase|nr:lipid-A-disaccharide synthase [Fusobacteriaceae bacterium]